MSQQHDFLGTEKISKLLWKQSIPSIIGLFVLSTYNLVDTIFVGRGVGTLGIAGLAIAGPIQMIIMSIAQTVGIGTASMISRSLGAKDRERAERTLGNFFTVTAALSLAITIGGNIFLEPLLRLFGATEQILPYAIEYMRPIFYGTLWAMMTPAFNNLIRAEGAARFAMSVMILSAITNIVLDPIFIYSLKMGIAGAAIATVISQFGAAMVVLFYFWSGRSGVRIHWRNFTLRWEIIAEMFSIGASVFARHASGSIMAVILNHSLGAYGGDIAIASFGVINRLLMFVFMPILGVIQGLQPILGYNYGAKHYRRAKESILMAIKWATGCSIAAFLFLMLFTKTLVAIFTSDTTLIALSISATRIIILFLPLVGFQIIAGGMYQSMGKAKQAFVLSVLRQIFLIPLVLLLPLSFGLPGLWNAFPLSDLFAVAITGIMVWHEMRLLAQLEKGA
ncbi:MatE family protein [Candidatus Moduliflexus flocculans]|uniref:Multidrug export protein MepA n=1 Tax=Candidatus Moduliflexus flocculans TaxID=1499966 RepID=A0A081BLT4_9BACT|nr:MatE family protein [Candidatus Moduliflexus flocculans]